MCEDGGYGFGAALAGREVVDDGDGDGEVEGGERVREGQDVGYGDGVRLVGCSDGRKVGGSVWRRWTWLVFLCAFFSFDLGMEGGASFALACGTEENGNVHDL